jgi:DNA-directed RNA polymerase specialized sigma24 family protein
MVARTLFDEWLDQIPVRVTPRRQGFADARRTVAEANVAVFPDGVRKLHEAAMLLGGTREGMAVARAKWKLRGKQPKLTDKQQSELRRMHDTGDYSISDLAEVFSISRPTVYRTLNRAK